MKTQSLCQGGKRSKPTKPQVCPRSRLSVKGSVNCLGDFCPWSRNREGTKLCREWHSFRGHRQTLRACCPSCSRCPTPLPRLSLPSIAHCPPGQAEPHHFAGGAELLPGQRRMAYLLACQSLLCLWKTPPDKHNSPLPIGCLAAPGRESQQSA